MPEIRPATLGAAPPIDSPAPPGGPDRTTAPRAVPDGTAPRVPHPPDLRTARTAFAGTVPRAPGTGRDGSILATTPETAAAIAAGDHQVRELDGRPLRFPSQRLDMIESRNPYEHGQTHVLTKHVGQTLQDDIARMRREPHISGAGGFTDAATAQAVVDRTIGNPAGQAEIANFLASSRATIQLPRVAFDRPIGTDLTRESFESPRPTLQNATTASVILIKDASFPEHYRVLTAYTTPKKPAVDMTGRPL